MNGNGVTAKGREEARRKGSEEGKVRFFFAELRVLRG
jgi:hypothetical protein